MPKSHSVQKLFQNPRSMKNYAGLIKIAHVCFLGFIIFNPMNRWYHICFSFSADEENKFAKQVNFKKVVINRVYPQKVRTKSAE